MELSLRMLVSMLILFVSVQMISCKPLNRGPSPPPVTDAPQPTEPPGTGLEYDRYLQQIVEVLESDEEFRKKLESANVSDIKSGAIASHLNLVDKNIRTKLDEIKRMEIQRLQQLARIRMRTANAGGRVNRMEIPSHLDLRNPHSFEMKDLENLIVKTTRDLEEVDAKRREDFKTYEMQKEYEYQQKLQKLPEEERQKLQKQHEELQQKHKDHEQLKHPGSKDQFEEVWEKKDHMEDQEFNPRTFFLMHDLNQDKFWDIQEVEAVLQSELEKAYDARNTPEEDDPMERDEEMNRMREHVFQEIDQNKDLMISLDEFIIYTGKQGDNKKFEENEGWETVDQKTAFTDEEYQEYVRQHQAQPGVVPAPVDDNLQFAPEKQLQQKVEQGIPQAQQGMPPHGVPQQGRPQEIPQGLPPQGMPQQGMPQQGMPERMPQQPQAIPQGAQGQGIHQQGVAQQGVPQGMPQHGTAQQGMPQQGMPQREMPQGVPQQGVAQQGVPQGMPQHGTAQQGMPQQGMPQREMPQGVPQQGVGQQGMPQEMPQQGAAQGLPQQGQAQQEALQQGVPQVQQPEQAQQVKPQEQDQANDGQGDQNQVVQDQGAQGQGQPVDNQVGAV